MDEAEFAGGEIVFCCAQGLAEGAAEDGAVSIEVAGAGGGVEDGAGFVVAAFVIKIVGGEGGWF